MAPREQGLAKVSDWLRSELDDGSAAHQSDLIEQRLRILAANLATPAVAGIVAALLDVPALAIVAAAMMAVGLVAVKLNPQARAHQVATCRHHVWGLIVGAGFFRLMVDLSTSTAPYGFPSLMGPGTSSIVVMLGTEIMPALLYTSLTLLPLFYIRSVVEEYRATRSRSDVHRDIALVGRYRKARRY